MVSGRFHMVVKGGSGTTRYSQILNEHFTFRKKNPGCLFDTKHKFALKEGFYAPVPRIVQENCFQLKDCDQS